MRCLKTDTKKVNPEDEDWEGWKKQMGNNGHTHTNKGKPPRSAGWSDMSWLAYRRTVKVKVAQLCPTLCDPTDYTVRGILQARIPEWVAFPFSRGFSQPQDWTQVSCTAGGFFTVWATREALLNGKPCLIRRKLTCYFLDNIARFHPPPLQILR